MLVYCQTICYLRKKLSIDLGSPGSRPLLQLQLFSNFFEILDPPFNFILPKFVWIHELCLFSLCYKFGLFWGQLFSCFSENCLCLQLLWVVEFKVLFENVVLWSEWFLSLISEVYFSFSPLFRRWNKKFSFGCSEVI